MTRATRMEEAWLLFQHINISRDLTLRESLHQRRKKRPKKQTRSFILGLLPPYASPCKAVRALHGNASRSFPIRSFRLRVAGCAGYEPVDDLVQRVSGDAATTFVAKVMEPVDLDSISTHVLPLTRLRDPTVYQKVTLMASGGEVLCDVELESQQQGSLPGKQMLRIAVQGGGSGRMGEAPLRVLPAVRAAPVEPLLGTT